MAAIRFGNCLGNLDDGLRRRVGLVILCVEVAKSLLADAKSLEY